MTELEKAIEYWMNLAKNTPSCAESARASAFGAIDYHIALFPEEGEGIGDWWTNFIRPAFDKIIYNYYN